MIRVISNSVVIAIGVLCATIAVPSAGAEERAIVKSPDDAALEWGPCPDFMPDGCRIAILHGDPTEPNADIFYRVPGGARIERHWHTSPERMLLVSGRLEVDYDGQQAAVIETGSYAYGPAKAPHRARCLSAEPCTLFIAFVEPIDAQPGAPDS